MHTAARSPAVAAHIAAHTNARNTAARTANPATSTAAAAHGAAVPPVQPPSACLDHLLALAIAPPEGFTTAPAPVTAPSTAAQRRASLNRSSIETQVEGSFAARLETPLGGSRPTVPPAAHRPAPPATHRTTAGVGAASGTSALRTTAHRSAPGRGAQAPPRAGAQTPRAGARPHSAPLASTPPGSRLSEAGHCSTMAKRRPVSARRGTVAADAAAAASARQGYLDDLRRQQKQQVPTAAPRQA